MAEEHKKINSSNHAEKMRPHDIQAHSLDYFPPSIFPFLVDSIKDRTDAGGYLFRKLVYGEGFGHGTPWEGHTHALVLLHILPGMMVDENPHASTQLAAAASHKDADFVPSPRQWCRA